MIETYTPSPPDEYNSSATTVPELMTTTINFTDYEGSGSGSGNFLGMILYELRFHPHTKKWGGRERGWES